VGSRTDGQTDERTDKREGRKVNEEDMDGRNECLSDETRGHRPLWVDNKKGYGEAERREREERRGQIG
jgi:hypothetical protein